MIAYFLLGIAILIGSVLLIRWFMEAEPKAVITALKWILALIGVALAFFLVLGGARLLAAIALPFLLPLLFRSGLLLQLFRRAKAARGPRPGQTSEVRTRYLRMTLDHDTGAMEGTVVEGAYRGYRLDEMTGEQVIDLWRTCRAEDEQSAQVLEAYLDRMQGAEWREAAGAGAADREEQEAAGRRGAGGGAMTRAEALEILGLEEGASESDVRDAHRKLMQKLHPDHGGSNYLATKLNQAKEILIRG